MWNQSQSEYKHLLTFRIPAMLSQQCTHALTANPPNTAQLDCTPKHSIKIHTGPCTKCGNMAVDKQTDIIIIIIKCIYKAHFRRML